MVKLCTKEKKNIYTKNAEAKDTNLNEPEGNKITTEDGDDDE